MASAGTDMFEKLVDHVVAEALGLLSNGVQQEIVIRKFGLRDGVYQSDREIGAALGINSREVRALGNQALQLIFEARQVGRIKVGAYG